MLYIIPYWGEVIFPLLPFPLIHSCLFPYSCLEFFNLLSLGVSAYFASYRSVLLSPQWSYVIYFYWNFNIYAFLELYHLTPNWIFSVTSILSFPYLRLICIFTYIL